MKNLIKPVKNSVAFVIYNRNRTHFLIVKRPPEDEGLPDVWGLPAGSLRDEETYEEAIVRSGREKLGVELKVVGKIGEGEVDRGGYILHMEEYEAEILQGEPQVPQPIPGITQYVQWKWGKSDDLIEAAQKGSLCSQLYLAYGDQKTGQGDSSNVEVKLDRRLPNPG
jgi:8-oxo-dGTP pyrophosphatase MutT (NUDIX family)